MSLNDTPQTESVVLARGGAAEQIIAHLHDQILRGELSRGTKLPTERALADRYGVSGATIREAIRGLAAMKMVEPRRGAGTFVTAETEVMFTLAAAGFLELNKIGLLDILETYSALHEKISRLVCENAEEAELAAILKLVDKLDAVETQADIIQYLGKFLGAIADASHNMLIAGLSKLLFRLQVAIALEQPDGLTGKVPTALRGDRRRWVEALIARNPDLAVKMAIRYNQHSQALVSDLVVSNGSEAYDDMHRAFRRIRRTS